MLLVTNMEVNNNNNIDVNHKISRFVTPGLFVEVGTETCHVGQNKEGGVVHVLDYSGDRTFNIKYVLDS